jgi:mannan endo-1,4-beta-mannosidase
MRTPSTDSRAPIFPLGGPVLAFAALVACASGCTTAGATARTEAGGGEGGAPGSTAGAGGGVSSSSGGGGPSSTTTPATFRTLLTAQYLSATEGGGGPLTAGSKAASAAGTFALTDLDGGALVDGDEVRLVTSNGGYVSAKDGGGGALEVSSAAPGDDETFVITRLAGPATIAPGDLVALKTKLKVNYISAIDGGGGEVRADAPWAKGWESFTIGLDGKTPPVTASTARQRVLDYIAAVSGSKTIAGQQNKDSKSPASHSDQIKDITGKLPGLWSADFGFGHYAVDNRASVVAEAKKQWSDGAIVQLMYHTCAVTRDEFCEWDDVGGAHPQHLTNEEWSRLVTDGTDLNQAWKARLDKLSVFFADLQAAGVAPLFRPLHEMNQGAFWWGGRGGANGTRKLWQITHDYLTKTKGFTNIIWVWDMQDFSTLDGDITAYHPGTEYYDIAALDMYEAGYTQHNYELMLGISGGKPIAIGECQKLPTSDLLSKQPRWAFFMLWPDFIDENKGVLPALYSAPNVITEDEMPGWK